jgi:adenine phosphoribosyltransferase
MSELYVPVTDGGTRSEYVNLQPWWRDPLVMAGIGELLATPFIDASPTVVIGPPARGHLLGGLVASYLGVGFAAVRKNPSPSVDSDPWLLATTPPDYQDRHLVLGLRRGILLPSDRVLAVDDVADTGGQLAALQRMVSEAGAYWVGASVALDLLDQNSVRRGLGVKTIFHNRDI